jgi:hypothetical protein
MDWLKAQIDNCEIKDAAGNIHLFENKAGGERMNIELDRVPQARFSFLLFATQCAVAACCAIVCHLASVWVRANSPGTFSTLLRNVLWREKRWFFWLILLFGMTVNLLYLAADWPGSMTPDSVFVHKELKQLQFTNHHPYSYSLLVLALHIVHDAPVTVAFFQILSFHTLCAFFFYVMYQRGVKLYVLIPLYALVPLSIPLNLFNITFWKDIPYSILVVFWALFLSHLYFNRIYEGKTASPSTGVTVLLSIAFLLLCTLRHNGIVYLPFIPLVLLGVCRVPRSWLLKFCTMSGLLLVLYYYVLPPLVLYRQPQLNNYAQQETSKYIGELASVTDSKKQHFVENYLADRTQKFVATLGTSSKASTWYNDMHAPPQRWFSVDEARAEMATQPLSGVLAGILEKFLETRTYTGLFSGRFIFWNSLFAFIGLLAAGGLYKWMPLSAFYASFFLYQSFFMYFVVWERWRYLYFIYLGGIFLLPVVALEISRIRKAAARL